MMKSSIEIKIHEIAHFFDKSFDKNFYKADFFSGSIGISFFLFYYSRFYRNGHYENKAMSFLSRSIKNIVYPLNYTYCGGISGVCWCIEHLLRNKYIHVENEELIQNFDNYLLNSALLSLKYGNNDFLHGAIGTATCLLKRPDNDLIKKGEDEIISILDKTKIKVGNSCFWNYKIGDKKFKGCNISLSHGMSSTCIFLIKAYRQGINPLITENLLHESIRFLLSQEIQHSKRSSMFPSFSLKDMNLLPSGIPYSRLGWCYGDLGIALAIWHYSQLFQDNIMEQKAIEIFLFSSKRRDLDKNYVIDGGICHGTAGIALIYRQMFLNTGIEIFEETSEYWIEQTLLMSKYQDGYVGYKADGINPSLGLLDGIAGIGLVLLSFLSDEILSWDECLLLS